MDYTINKLAKIAGVSTRTLRYYDQIGLLKPSRIDSSNYRIYGSKDVEKLQQIMFYRELGFELSQIKKMLNAPSFDSQKALYEHLAVLQKKRMRINQLIKNISKTIDNKKGLVDMTDKEKFEGFKQKMLDENEKKYGDEARKKYGSDSIDSSNEKFKGMTQQQYRDFEELSNEFNTTLKSAIATGDPSGELAQKACDLHKKWLLHFWADGTYSKESHKALAQTYVDDKRFTEYYEKIAPGAAKFLRDAINIYCS